MKRLLDAYAKYNSWANRRMANILCELETDVLTRHVVSSFPSLVETVRHMYGAEVIWYERLRHNSVDAFPKPHSQESAYQEITNWADFSDKLRDFVLQRDQNYATRSIRYQNTRGRIFTNSAGSILLHVFNHSTYHRGQLTTLCRQLEVPHLPPNDFIAYCRR